MKLFTTYFTLKMVGNVTNFKFWVTNLLISSSTKWKAKRAAQTMKSLVCCSYLSTTYL